MSMRWRLILSFVLVVVVAVGAVVVRVRSDSATQVRAYMARGGMAGVEELATQLEAYFAEQGSWEGVETLLASSTHMGGRNPNGSGNALTQRLRLANSAGLILVDTSGMPSGSLTSTEQAAAVVLEGNLGRTIGYLSLEGGMTVPQGSETRLLTRLNDAALRGGLIALGIGLVLALFLSASILLPVRNLTKAVDQMSSGDLSQRVEVVGSDELARLGAAFNQMAESLQQSEERRKGMTADIAHELRTPLAVQRAQLEAMQDGVYPLTPEGLQVAIDQTDVLARLVDDLRTMALADAGELTLMLAPVDPGDLLDAVGERFKPQAEAGDVQLSILRPSGKLKLIQGDRVRLEQILNNLLSNALRYTPAGGLVEVRLTLIGNQATISVHDSGPGIPLEALPHIFDRFYRAEKSRSRAEGGTGLGLAISRQLAHLHNGELAARNHPSGGAEFILTLPFQP